MYMYYITNITHDTLDESNLFDLFDNYEHIFPDGCVKSYCLCQINAGNVAMDIHHFPN